MLAKSIYRVRALENTLIYGMIKYTEKVKHHYI